MTATASDSLPVSAAPPADERSTTVLNGLLTEDLPLTVEVPPIALMDGEKIVRHPGDGTPVEWVFTGLSRDGDGHQVINYRTTDGATGIFPVTAPGTQVRVEVGQVYR